MSARARPLAADRARSDDPTQRELARLAWLLDSFVPLPGGLRIGLDGLIGLIPGLGDALGAFMSLYIVGRASRLGVPKSVLARMLGNVALDSLVGAIPIVGDVFDFVFKANRRNVELIGRYAAERKRVVRESRLAIAGVVAAAAVLAVAVVALAVALVRWLLSAI